MYNLENGIEIKQYMVSDADDIGFALTILSEENVIPINYPNVSIDKRPNEHTKATITGRITKSTYENYALRATSHMDVKIVYNVEGQEISLFQGVIQTLEIDAKGMGDNIVYEIKIEALSYTCLLDIQKKSRSFQNGSMTYDQMISEMISGYQQGAYLNYAAQGQAIGSYTMQYKETDWTFLKRMASRFHVPLVADHMSNGPRFSVGVIEAFEAVKIEDTEYKVIKKAENYREAIHNYYASINEVDFIYYEIKTSGPDMESLNLGDKVLYKDRLYYVISAHAEVKNYLLTHTYLLGVRNGFFCPPAFNQLISGLSLTGTAIKVARNMLKVHLDIDPAQSEQGAHWFQYATFYSTWYCMPEVGDRVNVHFPSVEESEAIVLNSVQKKPSKNTQQQPADMQSGVGGQTINAAQPVNVAQPAQGAATSHIHQTQNGSLPSGNNNGHIPVSSNSGGNASVNNQSVNGNTKDQNIDQNFDLDALAGDEKVKMIATDSGMMLILNDRLGCVSLVCSNDTYIQLSKSGGVSIITSSDIKLNSGKNVNIKATENFSVTADQKVSFNCGGSVIELTPTNVYINGVDIYLNK